MGARPGFHPLQIRERAIKMKFYIFDCNGQIVGNPAGYATIKGASRWANTRRMQALIWSTFDARADKSKTTVWQILEVAA